MASGIPEVVKMNVEHRVLPRKRNSSVSGAAGGLRSRFSELLGALTGGVFQKNEAKAPLLHTRHPAGNSIRGTYVFLSYILSV